MCLPSYSITCFGPPKGRFAYTTHSFKKRLSKSTLSAKPHCREFCTNLVLKTLLMAFTGNKNFLLCFKCCQWFFLFTPAPGTMQCRCGCMLRLCSSRLLRTGQAWMQVTYHAKLQNCFTCKHSERLQAYIRQKEFYRSLVLNMNFYLKTRLQFRADD